MPPGSKGEKRPADAIGAAVMIGKIATGEIDDLTTDDGKNAAAVALGRIRICLVRFGALMANAPRNGRKNSGCARNVLIAHS